MGYNIQVDIRGKFIALTRIFPYDLYVRNSFRVKCKNSLYKFITFSWINLIYKTKLYLVHFTLLNYSWIVGVS